MLASQEHCDLISMFERDQTFTVSRRFEKEDKSLWVEGAVYQDGRTNDLFIAYRNGYAFGRAVASQQRD